MDSWDPGRDAPIDAAASRGGRAWPLGLVVLIALAAATVTVGGLHAISDLVGPVFLGLVITVTVHPVRRWLERTATPEWLVSVLMLVTAYLLIVAMTLALVISVAQLASLLPEYSDDLADLAADVGGVLRSFGVDQQQIDTVVGAADAAQLVEIVVSLLAGTLGVLTDVFFLFTVLLFMAFDTNSSRRNLAVLGDRFPDVVSAAGGFAAGTRRYMAVAAIFGLVVAVVDGAALYLIGVPGAFVWAVLSFVTNFIPNIGFVIGLVPPALVALLEDGPGLMVTVIVVYCVVNFVIQSIIQPRVVGENVGLSPTITFLSLVFWAWVLGPVGALLAVPLSLLARAVLVEADARTAWALPLISGRTEASAPARADGG